MPGCWCAIAFRARRLIDAIVDLPFALPTAVAGIALTTLFAQNGWFGSILAEAGIKVAYTPLGIMVAMSFTSLPFIVRTVQPVLEDLDPALEEAAQTLGGSDSAIFMRVILPLLGPALLAGVSLSFARSLGEFGAIIFIAGNQPMETEITALLAFIRLEEYDYQAAAAIASVLLITAFLMLAVTNLMQARALRYTAKVAGMSAPLRRKPPRVGDSPAFRRALIAAVLIVGAFLILAPLVVILTQAFSLGIEVFADTIAHPDTRHAIWLTVVTALIAVPINTAFGVAAAWAITKFDFWGTALPAHRHRDTLLDLADRRRRRLSVRLRPAGRVRPGAGRRRHKDPVRAAGHRACLDVRHGALRRARADPADAGAGPRSRGGRDLARGVGLAHLLLGDAAQYTLGAALRRGALQRPRHGRVRRGVGRLRQYSRPDQHAAAAHRAALPRLPDGRRLRRRLHPHRARHRHHHRQGAARAPGRRTRRQAGACSARTSRLRKEKTP